MILYDRSVEHDLLVSQWWAQLHTDGDIETLIFRDSRSLSRFLEMLQPPTQLLFETDGTRIIFAAWFQPAFDGAFYSLWIAKEWRTVPKALDLVHQSYAIGFEQWPVLMGVTKQARLKKSHERLGYVWYEPPIPYLFDGEPAWLVVLTKERWEDGRRRKKGAPLQQET